MYKSKKCFLLFILPNNLNRVLKTKTKRKYRPSAVIVAHLNRKKKERMIIQKKKYMFETYIKRLLCVCVYEYICASIHVCM